MDRKTYYKYRSLDNFEFVLDILINNRLYATTYANMNDAMEGVYYSYGLPKSTLKEITEFKEELKICSLSNAKNNPLLWAHYANGSRGINIELEVTGHNLDIRNIKYSNENKIVNVCVNSRAVAKDILTHKHISWRYEEETRVFTTKDYVTIKIKRIILGEKSSKRHRDLLKGIINIINDSEKRVNKIEVIEYKDFVNEVPE